MRLSLFLLFVVVLMSETVMCHTFYTDHELPSFSTEEQQLLDEINLEFAPLTVKTRVETHNRQMKKLVAEHGNDWHKNLVESFRELNNEHAIAIAQLTRSSYIDMRNGHVKITYCTNGMICERTVTKDLLNGGSNRAYFKHKITEFHYDQEGNFQGRRTYEQSGSMCCFIGTTMISMANGEERPIREIAVGDSVITYDFEKACFVGTRVNEVTAVEHEELVKLSFSNNVVYTTTDHPFPLFNGGWAAIRPDISSNYFKNEAIKELEVGDTLYYKGEEGMSYTVLESVEYIKGSYMTYTINELEDGSTFVANFLLVGVEYLPFDHPLRKYLSVRIE